MQAAEADDILLRQRDLLLGFLDEDAARKYERIAPVQLEKVERPRHPLQLAHPDRTAQDAQMRPELEEDLARQADAPGLAGARDAPRRAPSRR
ncbi:MAG: hypothetical protein JO090_03335 [Rhizobacter sp.]|nr:hypothetical protein [Rhizobacter sp.]